MFGQIKDLYNLQKQAREMKSQMEAEQITGTSKDSNISITVNGSYEIKSVKVNPDVQLSASQIESGVKEAYQTASDSIKSVMMEKFKGMM